MKMTSSLLNRLVPIVETDKVSKRAHVCTKSRCMTKIS